MEKTKKTKLYFTTKYLAKDVRGNLFLVEDGIRGYNLTHLYPIKKIADRNRTFISDCLSKNKLDISETIKLEKIIEKNFLEDVCYCDHNQRSCLYWLTDNTKHNSGILRQVDSFIKEAHRSAQEQCYVKWDDNKIKYYQNNGKGMSFSWYRKENK